MSETERLRGSGQTERELQAECDELRSKNQQLNSALGELRLQTREEVDRVKRSELDRCKTLEREVERLAGLQSVVQDEASSLKYQLSSTSMEVQQMKEVREGGRREEREEREGGREEREEGEEGGGGRGEERRGEERRGEERRGEERRGEERRGEERRGGRRGRERRGRERRGGREGGRERRVLRIAVCCTKSRR